MDKITYCREKLSYDADRMERALRRAKKPHALEASRKVILAVAELTRVLDNPNPDPKKKRAAGISTLARGHATRGTKSTKVTEDDEEEEEDE